MTKMRQDFEAAYRAKFGRDPALYDAHAVSAWWAWKTATPKAFGDGWCAAKGLERPESLDCGHTDD